MKTMKGTALAVAVAAALGATAVAQADTILYGSVRPSVDYTEYDGVADDDGTWDVVNNASRLGVKGSEDLGNGLAAVYQYEFGVDVADTGTLGGRLAYVGLKGSFGTVALGRQWTVFYNNVGATTDVFNGSLSAENYLGAGGMTRTGNVLAYISPDFSGLTIQAAAVIDGSNGTEGEDVDAYQLGATYKNGGLLVGAGYHGDQNGDVDIWGLTGSYTFDAFSITGLYQSYTDDNNEANDKDAYELLGAYTFGSNVVRASWGQVDPENGDKQDTWILGYQYNLSKRTRLWAEYGDSEATINQANGSESVSNLSLGIRHDF